MRPTSPFANADLTDRILTSLPDFKTLQSTILTSKSIYSVFRNRPHSIVRAVAYNQIGPALPQAVRLVRCGHAKLWLKPVDELLGEDELVKHSILTNEEVRMLVDKAKVVEGLEDIFSWREKDRNFTTSQLSAAESARFHRAMYRIWLFATIYGHTACVHRDDIEFDEHETRQHEKKFLASFVTPELREIERLATFMCQIATWAENAGYTEHEYFGDSFSDFALFHGPHAVLAAYSDDMGWVEPFDDDDFLLERYDGFLFSAVSRVLEERKQSHMTDEQAKKIVLDNIIGGEDKCERCQSDSVKGTSLWGPNNWSFLPGFVRLYDWKDKLKGRLGFNIAETVGFNQACSATPWPILIGEVFDQKTEAYDLWNKDDWICRDCLEIFLKNHLHLWYLEKKRETGVIPENCWYGYNCRTQMHNMDHARKLNHWCEPTKGDP
ncbi:hypothetical protein BV22DRAFT_1036762 [Leucogyrophana mollusca]|uniref:Uncharacterized protein n=1 Tax=Leucogyrophana mollusca TaxID=85980 RepID=A0ACB8BE19_9AGAM|nr:hypothetical protein BV22DRAFT_1036762 [Leucogyrophana mollusca]